MREWIARQFCRIGRCSACTTYETPEGIGGKCVRCGKIHGWVTRDELRAFTAREAAKATVVLARSVRDFKSRRAKGSLS